ncbi:MAG: hypothetical protein ACYCUI_01360 [Vulcanimicrobiaceae bacterium]
MATRVPKETLIELLTRYGLVAHPQARPPRTHARAEASIICAADWEQGAGIALDVHGHRAFRLVPLSAYEAGTMVVELQRAGVLPHNEHLEKTLAHLLARSAEIFAERGLDRLELRPVHLWDGGYSVEGADAHAGHPIHLRPRRHPDANDRAPGNEQRFEPLRRR